MGRIDPETAEEASSGDQPKPWAFCSDVTIMKAGAVKLIPLLRRHRHRS